MPIRRGTYYSRTFLLTQPNGTPLDITGWELLAEFKAGKDEQLPALVSLTSANGGWSIPVGTDGKLVMHLLAADTNALVPSKVYWDVLRTDIDPGPVYLFEASVPVKDTITSVP